MNERIRQNVERAILQHRLIAPGDHVLVGVSGGADSVALAYLLHFFTRRVPFRLTFAHLNHGLRGVEAEADERFVRDMARVLSLSCRMGSADVTGLARQQGVSLEMAARKARHDFFRSTLSSTGADRVALAHTADDQAETTLLRLVRGTGARGLSAMRHRDTINGIPFIRPLLDVAREEIHAFLRAHGLRWREDASNQSPAHLRNRVRHELLPLLEQRFNPGVRRALHHTAEILAAEDEWLERVADRLRASCMDGRALKVASAHPLHPALQRRILRSWLESGGFPGQEHTYAAIEQLRHLLAQPHGTRRLSLAGNWYAVQRYGLLTLESPASTPAWSPTVLTIPGTTEIPGAGCRIRARLGNGFMPHPTTETDAQAYIDAGKLAKRAVVARPWQPGDRMQPLGLAGHRKLQDVFTDLKIPRDQRHRLPVFTCGEEILWVPGWRVAADWAVRGPEAPSLHLTVSLV